MRGKYICTKILSIPYALVAAMVVCKKERFGRVMTDYARLLMINMEWLPCFMARGLSCLFSFVIGAVNEKNRSSLPTQKPLKN